MSSPPTLHLALGLGRLGGATGPAIATASTKPRGVTILTVATSTSHTPQLRSSFPKPHMHSASATPTPIPARQVLGHGASSHGRDGELTADALALRLR